MQGPLALLDKPFAMYTNNGPEMNGRTFVKVFQDSQLIDKDLNSTDLDIIFSKIKTKGTLKINLQQFAEGVRLVAEKKKMELAELCETLSASTGPKFTGTKVQHVELHDNKETYTGVYARGGPTNVDKDKGTITNLNHTYMA